MSKRPQGSQKVHVQASKPRTWHNTSIHRQQNPFGASNHVLTLHPSNCSKCVLLAGSRASPRELRELVKRLLTLAPVGKTSNCTLGRIVFWYNRSIGLRAPAHEFDTQSICLGLYPGSSCLVYQQVFTNYYIFLAPVRAPPLILRTWISRQK